jgi:excisionase family DNA binding protein
MKRSLSATIEVLTVTELCTYLKVDRSTVYRLIKAGKLPAFKVGGDWRFNVEEIDRWRFERQKKPGM